MIFSKEVEKVCAYCEHGKPIFGTNDVICKKHGLMNITSGCRHFLYSPLRRNPPKKAAIPKKPDDLPEIDDLK